MRLTIAAVGRARQGPERALYEHYAGRITWALNLREVEEKRTLPAAELMKREGELVLAACPPGALLIALDRRGTPTSSEELASLLRSCQREGPDEVAFLIGGAEGHGDAVRKACRQSISFGAATWPHLLARAMLAEQILFVDDLWPRPAELEIREAHLALGRLRARHPRRAERRSGRSELEELPASHRLSP